MKCKLSAISVKLFAKAIHSLAKLGSDIYIEPLEDGLAVKTVNSSRSAYASYLFLQPMFEIYEQQCFDQEENFKCKVAVKTMLQVFKSLSSIEKSVECCEINSNDDECRLVFQLKCRHGIVKTHQLTFQECESLQAIFAKDLLPNVLKCTRKLLNDVVVNFPSNLEEITLTVSPCQVTFKTYVDGDDTQAAMMKTEMTLNPDEFTDFQVGVDTDITFSVKDLRAVLAFCDVADMPVNFYFETGGKPLVISVEQENGYKANFVLATICDDQPSQQKTFNKSAAQVGSLKRKNSVQDIKQNASKKTNSNPTSNGINGTNNIVNPNNTTMNEDEISPEIPNQNYQSVNTPVYQPTQLSRNSPDFQGVRRLFFEPSQATGDRSLVVLAPDSDDENS